jgi:hypothetical protein
VVPRGIVAALYALCLAGPCSPVSAAEPIPQSPAAFLPGGLLGLQIGSPWGTRKSNPSLGGMHCQSGRETGVFDEICFFKTSSRLANAEVHDGFIVRKGDRIVLIGTGISIKNPDDPLAEEVMRDFEAQIHAQYQQTGGDVLFVNMPPERMSAAELAGFSQTAPVLLVELEPKGNELAVFYGYLAPVNAFSALISN